MPKESTFHIKNIKVLMTEIYQLLKGIFHHSQRNPSFLVPKPKFISTYAMDTISFRVPQSCQDLPQDIKSSDSLNCFSSDMKIYETLSCRCKIFKTFVPCVGYID